MAGASPLPQSMAASIGSGRSPAGAGGGSKVARKRRAAVGGGGGAGAGGRPNPSARGVIEVRKEAKDGDEVVVVGRVGGSTKPFVEGRASFLIVDPSLKPAQHCDCPWDYCETPDEQRKAARATIRFADDRGKTLTA